VYSPNSITLPINDQGRRSFRLDQIAPANGFAHDEAHEAVADVEATIHVARLIKERAPEVWQRVLGPCRKADAVRMASSAEPYSLTEFYFGREHSFPVVHCGTNPDYDAEVGAFDLQYVPSSYLHLSTEELVEVLNTSLKVIRTIRANTQPIVMPLSSLPESSKSHFPDQAVMDERASAILADVEFQRRVGHAM
jgi:exodeoxyribonuclease-1